MRYYVIHSRYNKKCQKGAKMGENIETWFYNIDIQQYKTLQFYG